MVTKASILYTNLLCCKISNLSYVEGEIELQNRLREIGFDLIHVFNRDDTQGIYVGNGKINILAFRGTEFNFGDIYTDLRWGWYKDRGVHSGFYHAWKSVERGAMKVVENSPVPVYITGHSLGGAIAKVGTSIIGGYIRCITFGAPKCFNADVDFEMEGNITNYINIGDPIPYYPFWLFGYDRKGNDVYLTNSSNGFFLKGSESNWWFRLRQKLKSFLPHSILNHRIDEYLRKIEYRSAFYGIFH